MKKAYIQLIKLYQKAVSPFLILVFGGGCRYSPTCSEYFLQAVDKYGVIKGSQKGFARILSCHPFSKKPHLDPLK